MTAPPRPQLAQLLVVMGPIASGKSSVATRVAERLLAIGRRSAVVDLDDVAECLVAPLGEWESTWRRARGVHDELVGAFRRSGVDHVIAHGSFFYLDEPPAVRVGVHDVAALRVLLSVPYDVALERVGSDPERGITKNPEFLRWTHDRFAERASTFPKFNLEFDTTLHSADEVASAITAALET